MKEIVIPILVASLILIGIGHAASLEDGAYEHLYNVMDKFHSSLDVYTDRDTGGNHYVPSGFMGDLQDINFDDAWTANPHSGPTCIRIVYSAMGAQGWAGIYWQDPANNWGDMEGGYDLTGATELSFWARCENGEEGEVKGEFKMGGIGDPAKPYRDSCGPLTTQAIVLSDDWTRYTIDLNGQDLSRIIGGFCWVTNKADNPNGCTIYLDDIRYDKDRLDELRFLTSYEATASAEDNSVRNAAYIYDNALAVMSFMIQGNWERARIIADSFLYVQNNDRYFSDGRLRNAYRSGDLADHLSGEAQLPGWRVGHEQIWQEDELQVGTFTGDMAWIMIALLDYYREKGGQAYLEAAEEMGSWIIDHCYDTRGDWGYKAGYKGWRDEQVECIWKSTEHNIGVYVAFTKLYHITGDAYWQTKALHAKTFVESMWNNMEGYFWAGTLDDGVTTNYMVLPLDPQTWGFLAMDQSNTYGRAISWAEANCSEDHICPDYPMYPDFTGFDFNTDRDGVWFEGTAQMCVAFIIKGESAKSDWFIAEIRKAQSFARSNNGKGIVAACHDGVTTGFDQVYNNRLHVGATSWYIFAERGYNPLYTPQIVKELYLHQGWNLISLCLDIEDTRPASVLASISGSYISVWTYDANPGGWKVYIPYAPSPPNNLDSIDFGKGYWVYMVEGDTLLVSGKEIGETAISLYEGLNLMGYNYETTRPLGEVLSSISGDYKCVYTYDPVNSEWKMHAKDAPDLLNNLEVFEPGKGYLIDVESDCVWNEN